MREILLSINSKHIEAIMNGQKQVEYRSWEPSCRCPFKVFIYATQPIGVIIGEFIVYEILEDSKDNLWEKNNDVGGISYDLYSNYFNNKNRCYAFRIDNIVKYETSITLNDLGIEKTPQRFIYLRK